MTAPVLMSVRCPISKLPVPHASSSRRQQLCAGGFAALGTLEQPFELCRALGGFAKSGLGDGQTPPWADTCAVEVCKVPDTLGGSDLFFFQLLTQPDRSSLRVFRFGRANKIPLHCEISGSVPAHPPLLSLWHCPTLGNYWHCVGHIKFPINQCVAISLLQPPLLLLCNRSSSGISSSFHSHLLISSDIFQGWFLYCFRDMFLASSFCLLLETEHTWEECQKCDRFAHLFLPVLLPPSQYFHWILMIQSMNSSVWMVLHSRDAMYILTSNETCFISWGQWDLNSSVSGKYSCSWIKGIDQPPSKQGREDSCHC